MSNAHHDPHPRILVIEDAPEIVQLITGVLTRDDGYVVESATDGATGIETAQRFEPDLVILDLGLPGIDGIEVCRQLRTFTDAYVIMLTGRDDEVDKLVGLAVGADDYMTKPFSSRELVARVQAMLRRPRGGLEGTPTSASADESTDTIQIGPLTIDTLAREVSIEGNLIDLTKIEFDLLATLASRPDMVFTRQLLVDSVWGSDWYGDDHMVSVHVANLRKKIDGDSQSFIKTVRGVGYRINRRSE